MGYATILGLDLGKFKSVCCVMDAATGTHRFETLATTPDVLHELLARHAGTTNTTTPLPRADPPGRPVVTFLLRVDPHVPILVDFPG